MTQHQSNSAATGGAATLSNNPRSGTPHGPADNPSDVREAEDGADSEPSPARGYQWVWLGQFTWGDACECEGVTGNSRADVTRKLLRFFESWRRENPKTVVEDAWLTSPNYVHYGMKQRLCGPVPQAVPTWAQNTAWTNRSPESSVDISLGCDARREQAVIKADDEIRRYILQDADEPHSGFKAIDATIAKAVDMNLGQADRDKARVRAIQIIINRGFGYPYDDWMETSLLWWNMKQRHARDPYLEAGDE